MADIQLLMPEMGESVTDATLSKWLVKEGDTVQAEQDILEVSTDKVDTEVPSPATGTIVSLLHQEGEVVEVGKPLAIIATEDHAAISASPAVAESHEETYTEAELKVPFVPPAGIHESIATFNSPEPLENNDNTFYSPLVRSIAKAEHIDITELKLIQGTGLGGRITKDDMMAYLTNKQNHTPTKAKHSSSAEISSPITTGLQQEVVEMDKMRKLIADHMIHSKQTSAHATLFMEVDVTNLYQWRNKAKADFLKRTGEKLTFTPLFIKAVSNAILQHPGINISITNDYKIIHKKAINIGMAAALPSGNLIVPVIKHTSDKTIAAIAKEVNDLANRSRTSKLKPDDTAGGTFTITNIGTFNNILGTPIINQPQVAILATGAIQKKPVVIETPAGDTIGIRKMMYLSLSIDHRIVDGALGGAFLNTIAQELENWDINQIV